MNVLTIDIGGTNIKFLVTGQTESRRFPSGLTLTPTGMVTQVKELTRDWRYDRVTIGYPGLVLQGRIAREPNNLAPGWIGFDFEAAFGCPVKLINDAAMQALGSYQSGTMLFLGLGTGLGAAMVVQGVVVPMELGHLPYRKGSFETYLGKRGLARLGKKKWRRHVEATVNQLISALELDDVVIGGGNVKKLKQLPKRCRAGDNANAFLGGFRFWEEADKRTLSSTARA
ncbi:MAG TPA: ROK family protein [Coleofasciculaceae cyanobacterium]